MLQLYRDLRSEPTYCLSLLSLVKRPASLLAASVNIKTKRLPLPMRKQQAQHSVILPSILTQATRRSDRDNLKGRMAPDALLRNALRRSSLTLWVMPKPMHGTQAFYSRSRVPKSQATLCIFSFSHPTRQSEQST